MSQRSAINLGEQTAALLVDDGFPLTEAGRQGARERLTRADEEWTSERFRQLREQLGRPRPTS